MEKDVPGAIKYVKQSVAHAKAAGFREGVREGGDALKRGGGVVSRDFHPFYVIASSQQQTTHKQIRASCLNFYYRTAA
jgi:hypothetical protein